MTAPSENNKILSRGGRASAAPYRGGDSGKLHRAATWRSVSRPRRRRCSSACAASVTSTSIFLQGKGARIPKACPRSSNTIEKWNLSRFRLTTSPKCGGALLHLKSRRRATDFYSAACRARQIPSYIFIQRNYDTATSPRPLFSRRAAQARSNSPRFSTVLNARTARMISG